MPLLCLIISSACYISRAAWEEARILAARKPIVKLLADPDTPEHERSKLSLVTEARNFAIDSLHLNAGETFTQFSRLNRDTLVLVVSASYPDRMERLTWWFPVVGRFPYKGFFDFDKALSTADKLKEQGMDVSVGASSAFSTLGWFNDPLVSTTLRMDSISLVNTVIHEIAHTTFFAKGNVVFNESFASFVGGRAAIEFFKFKGDSASLLRAEREWHNEKILGAFWASLYNSLDSAFRENPDIEGTESRRALRMTSRQVLYAQAREKLVDSIAPLMFGASSEWAQRVRLDNAVLMARRVYATGLDDFEKIWLIEEKNLTRAVKRIVEIAEQNPGNPFEALKAAASGH